MTTEQVHALRKSFEQIEKMGHVAALVFYRRLFELAPQVRPLFHHDIESQAKKLTNMIAAALSLLERPGELQSTLEMLGARHVDYGARPEHYPIVAQSLLDMLASVLGPQFTPDLRQTWVDLLNQMADAMLRGAAKAGGPVLSR